MRSKRNYGGEILRLVLNFIKNDDVDKARESGIAIENIIISAQKEAYNEAIETAAHSIYEMKDREKILNLKKK